MDTDTKIRYVWFRGLHYKTWIGVIIKSVQDVDRLKDKNSYTGTKACSRGITDNRKTQTIHLVWIRGEDISYVYK